MERLQTHLIVMRMLQWCFVNGLETQSLPLHARICWPFKSPTAVLGQTARAQIDYEDLLERGSLSCLDAFADSLCHNIIC
jgi:hypothetical protein